MPIKQSARSQRSHRKIGDLEQSGSLSGNCLCGSLLRRPYLTSVSNVYKAAPISLFWAPNGLNELLEIRFEFPFRLIGKLTMAFSRGQSWHVLKSWYKGWGPEQGFPRCFADRLNQSLVSSVAQGTPVVPLKFSSYLIELCP